MGDLSFLISTVDQRQLVITAFAFPRRLAEWAGFYNYVEVGLWPAMAVVMTGYAVRRRGVVRVDCIVAALTLALFGASDWFEEANGNEWWHPWWLLLWKCLCGATLFTLVIRAAVRKKRLVNRLVDMEAGGMIHAHPQARGR